MVMGSFSYTLRSEPERNVIFMTQRGRPEAEDFRRLKSELAAQVEGLKPGFILVNDQRRLEPFDENAMAVALELVELVNDRGVSTVIRIVPADLMTLTKVVRANVTAESTYRIIRVSTPAEAEKLLARL